MSLQAGIIEEMVNEAMDDALDSEDIEEETEEEIEKVLTAIAGETAAQLPDAVRKQKLKQPATSEQEEVCVYMLTCICSFWCIFCFRSLICFWNHRKMLMMRKKWKI